MTLIATISRIRNQNQRLYLFLEIIVLAGCIFRVALACLTFTLDIMSRFFNMGVLCTFWLRCRAQLSMLEGDGWKIKYRPETPFWPLHLRDLPLDTHTHLSEHGTLDEFSYGPGQSFESAHLLCPVKALFEACRIIDKHDLTTTRKMYLFS